MNNNAEDEQRKRSSIDHRSRFIEERLNVTYEDKKNINLRNQRVIHKRKHPKKPTNTRTLSWINFKMRKM